MIMDTTATAGGSGPLTPVALSKLLTQLGTAGVPPDASITFRITDSQADGTNWAASVSWRSEDVTPAPSALDSVLDIERRSGIPR